MNRSSCDGVMLIGFGGPTAPEEVRPFLDRVLAGRPVPRTRYEEVVHHYEMLGGRSPYNELTMRQARALTAALVREGLHLPVGVGMRNTAPFLQNALRDLHAAGAHRVLGFILAAYRCEASWERYQQDVRIARETMADPPEVIYPRPWHTHPLFIDAQCDQIRKGLEGLDQNERKHARLIFTAHSIPCAMAEGSPYVNQLHESARMIAGRLGFGNYTLAFQSRSGNPREPWLEPDILDVLSHDRSAAVVAPIGFLCDHVEVLYDLDIEAAGAARAAGVHMVRAATVSDHPKFIEMIIAVIRLHTAQV
jgi:ferrochelatase